MTAFLTRSQGPQTLAGDVAFNFLSPACLERKNVGGCKQKIYENLDSSAEKGQANAQLRAMSTLIGFVLIAEVWTPDTKSPAVHFNPPQALFICGLLLFLSNTFFLYPPFEFLKKQS